MLAVVAAGHSTMMVSGRFADRLVCAAMWQQCTKQYQDLPGPGPCAHDIGSPLFWSPAGTVEPTYLVSHTLPAQLDGLMPAASIRSECYRESPDQFVLKNMLAGRRFRPSKISSARSHRARTIPEPTRCLPICPCVGGRQLKFTILWACYCAVL